MTFSEIYDAAPAGVQDAVAFVFRLLEAPEIRSLLTNSTPSQSSPYRARLVSQIWESDLRAELVDRLVELVAGGTVKAEELDAAVARAKAKKQLYKDSGGDKGAPTLWISLGAWCKAQYDAAGFKWTPTAPRLEPKPSPRPRRVLRESNDGTFPPTARWVDDDQK